MVKKSFFGKAKRGRPENQEKILFKIPTGLSNKKQSKPIKYTKRERKITRGNVSGAGLGFVIGTALGGFGGMVIGVPAGTLAGNLIAKKRAGKQRGRHLTYQKTGFFNKLTSTRSERLSYNKMMMRKKK